MLAVKLKSLCNVKEIIAVIGSNKEFLNAKDDDGNTAFTLAADQEHYDIAYELVIAGADYFELLNNSDVLLSKLLEITKTQPHNDVLVTKLQNMSNKGHFNRHPVQI